jgi:hypothetical protein
MDAHALGSSSSGNETHYEHLLRHLAKTPANRRPYIVYYTDRVAREPLLIEAAHE